MLRHLDLFSGIGGFTKAAKQLGGIQTTQFVEIDPDGRDILRSQFPDVPIHSDIKDYCPEPEFDLITMGFPCTGTSNAGTRTGIKHPASSLWREGLRCLMLVRPKFCIIEQPEGIIGRGLRAILGGLSLAGYAWEIETVTARELGAGHQRLRLFIVSYPDEQRILYEQTCWSERTVQAPEPSSGVTSSQMREMVQRQRANSTWLSVKQSGDRDDYGISPELVRGSNSTVLKQEDYTEPNKTPGRIRARYLAGRTVTPGQAAVALRRVLYLNSFTGG